MKILFCLLSYLLGSIPSGYLLFRLSEKRDIRNLGSQSTGATNVLRLKGWRYAVPVAIIDVAKGALPVYLGLRLFAGQTFAIIAAFLAVAGHCFPVYIKFRGGKGVATTMGAFAVLSFKPLLLSLALFVIVIAITRYVSLGSLLATLSLPLFIWLFEKNFVLALGSLAVFFIILVRHADNLQRLIKGKERKLGEKAGI